MAPDKFERLVRSELSLLDVPWSVVLLVGPSPTHDAVGVSFVDGGLIEIANQPEAQMKQELRQRLAERFRH